MKGSDRMNIRTVGYDMPEQEKVDRIVQLEIDNVINKLGYQSLLTLLMAKGDVTQEEITHVVTQVLEGMKPKLEELKFDTELFEKIAKSQLGL
jgi:hypothetical protein